MRSGGSKATDGTTDPTTNTKVLTATVNGSPFTATTVVGAYLNGSISING